VPCISQRTRRFGGIYRLHLQRRQVKQARNRQKQAASSARKYRELKLKRLCALYLLLWENSPLEFLFLFHENSEIYEIMIFWSVTSDRKDKKKNHAYFDITISFKNTHAEA
jgi:hypothetical protein